MSMTDSDTGTSPFGMQSNPVMPMSSMQSRLQTEFANEQDRARFAEALRIRHDWELERRLEMERRELETRAQMLARERIRLQEIQNDEEERARCQLYLGQEKSDVAMPMLNNFGRKLGNLERRRRERRAAGKSSASGDSGGSGSNARSSETAGSAERPPLVTKSSDESGETAMGRPGKAGSGSGGGGLESPRSPTSRSTGTGSSRNLGSESSGKDALYESTRRVQQWSGTVADAGDEKVLAAPERLPRLQVPVEALLVASARSMAGTGKRTPSNEEGLAASSSASPEEPLRPLRWAQPLQLEPPAEVSPPIEKKVTDTAAAADTSESKPLSPILRSEKPTVEEDRRRVLFAENLPNRHTVAERPALGRSSSISGANPSSQSSPRGTSITLVSGMSPLRRSSSAREQTPSSTGFVIPKSPSSHGYSSTVRLSGEEPAPTGTRFRPNLLRTMSAGTASSATSTHNSITTDSEHNASGADSANTQAGTSIESGSRSSDKTAQRKPMAWDQALLSPAAPQEKKGDDWETRAEARRRVSGLGSGSGSRGLGDANPIEAAFAAEIGAANPKAPPTPRAPEAEQATHAESVFGSSSLGPGSPGTSTIYSSTGSRSSRRRRRPYNGPSLPEIESKDDLDMFHLAFDDLDGPQPSPPPPDFERAISPKTETEGSEDLQVREFSSSGTDVPVVAPTALSESGTSSFGNSSRSKRKQKSPKRSRLPELGESSTGDRSIDEAVRQTMKMTLDNAPSEQQALSGDQGRKSAVPEIHNAGFLRRHGTFTSARAPLMALRGDGAAHDPLASDHRFDTIDADQLRSAAEAGDQLAEAHLHARTRRGPRRIEQSPPAIEPAPSKAAAIMAPPPTPSRKSTDVVRRQSAPLMASIPEHSRADVTATPAERKQSADIAQTFGDASRRSSEASSGSATPAPSTISSGSDSRSGSVGSALDALVSTTLAAVDGKGNNFAVETAGLPMRIARSSADSSAPSTIDTSTTTTTNDTSGPGSGSTNSNVRSTIIVGGGRSAFTPLGAAMTHRLSSAVATVPPSPSTVSTRASPAAPPELSVRGQFIAALTQPSTALLSDVARMASEAGSADRARERRSQALEANAAANARRTAAAALIPVAQTGAAATSVDGSVPSSAGPQKSHVFTSSHVGRSTAAANASAMSASSRRSSGSKSHRRSTRRSTSVSDSNQDSPSMMPPGQGLLDKLPTSSKEEILSRKLADYQRTLEAGAGLGITVDPNQEGPPNRPNSPVRRSHRERDRDLEGRPEETKEERRARRALRRRQKMQLEHERLMRDTPWEQAGNPFEAAAARALGVASPTTNAGPAMAQESTTSPMTVDVPPSIPEDVAGENRTSG